MGKDGLKDMLATSLRQRHDLFNSLQKATPDDELTDDKNTHRDYAGGSNSAPSHEPSELFILSYSSILGCFLALFCNVISILC